MFGMGTGVALVPWAPNSKYKLLSATTAVRLLTPIFDVHADTGDEN